MGLPLGILARSMTEREFRQWQGYAARKMLPQRRLEFYLAQIALTVARAVGGAEGLTLRDFLFDPTDDGPGVEVDLDELKAELAFSPKN